MNNICELVVRFFGILFVLIFLGIITDIKAREELIQELCTKKQYDFCEVKKTVYKLKEQDNEI